MNSEAPTQTEDSTPLPLEIQFYLADGSRESYMQKDQMEAEKLWSGIDPARIFSHSRIVLGGDFSKAVFACSHLVRVDFIRPSFECWTFPGGYSDVVEITEADYRRLAHLDEPALMERRDQPRPVGELLVSFLELKMSGGLRFYLMVELPVTLPAESQSFTHFLLSKGAIHMRLSKGGQGIINLAHLIGYTTYPGVSQLPQDFWKSEPKVV